MEVYKAPKKKRASKQKGPRSDTLWTSAEGWKSLDAADEFLLGAEEGGFAGLEVLDDVSLIDADYLASLNAASKQQIEAEAGTGGKAKGKKQCKATAAAAAVQGSKRKRADAAADTAEAAGDDVAALKAKLRQLEAENTALKKQKKHDKPAQGAAAAAVAAVAAVAPASTGDGSAAPADQPAGDKLSRKQQRLEKRRQKLLERKLRQKEQKALLKQQRQQQQQGTAADAQASPQADMTAWSRFCLHPKLEAALAVQGFTSPTPIQDAVLLPAIRDRRDVIGAAQTGSGKTLAFGLPILQVLLQEQELQQLQQQQDGKQPAAKAAIGGGGGDWTAVTMSGQQQQQQQQHQSSSPLRALILAPTRELALQVSEHLQTLGKQVGIRVAPLVGGIAPVKQERLLRACPPIVVATPGRLWDLIRHGHKHVSDLEHLSFFVLDEADRMVQQGHYQELNNIMELLPTPDRAAAMAAAAAAEAQEQQRLEEAAAVQKEKLSKSEQRQQQGGGDDDDDDDDDAGSEPEDEHRQELAWAPHVANDDDDLDDDDLDDDDVMSEDEDAGQDLGEDQDDQRSDEDLDQDPESTEQPQQQRRKGMQQRQQQRRGQQPKLRGMRHHLLQTFVFSATLTLPAQLHKRLRRGGGGSSGAASLENLMDRLSFRDRPAIVDLSPSSQLADRVQEGLLQTLEPERDATLYYVLARHPGRALVFVNAVSAVRRVAALLQLLGLPAVALHAQQQQRQRLKALDRFKSHPHGVLVATDVAARGLDIPDVQIVVHYQLPASADTYIHRSGRTARTGGIDGVVLAMVTPADASRWAALRRALEGQAVPPTFPIDNRVLAVAKQRVALAAKIDAVQRQDRKAHAKAAWARSNADAAGIALSDAELEDEGLRDLTHSAVAAAKKGGRLAGKAVKGKEGGKMAGLEGFDRDSQSAAEKSRAAQQLTQGLAALQRQLATELSTPLQPSISHKFFTGGMSAAAAAAAAAGSADVAGDGVTLKPHSMLSATAIAETVQMAARLNQSRAGKVAAAGGSGGLQSMAVGGVRKKQQQAGVDSSKARRKAAAALAAAAAAKKGVGLAGVVKKGKGGKLLAPQQAAIARMLMSKNEKKRQKRQGGMVVVRPGAAGVFGRDAQGVSALDVLNMGR